ncbi:MAG: citrate/2-methylcitrate synthase [bacterium]|nr:citrate/2-methylcitrate synthase [bacterium]
MSDVSYSRGLAGVIADESRICTIDGEKGELYYSGYPIQTLARESSYPETVYLLLYGELPKQNQLNELINKLKDNSKVPPYVLQMLDQCPKDAHPMRILQLLTAALGMHEKQDSSWSMEDKREAAIKLIAAYPTIIAAASRHRRSLPILEPRTELDHSANFLYMLHGEVPNEKIVRMFDVCLILHAEHTFNASTFTGRVVGSTLSDLHSAVAAAVGALYGPLHGGANERVLHMVDEIGSIENLNTWFETAMTEKKKVMGMGHRVYKTIDPRAKILGSMLEELASEKNDTSNLEILKALQAKMAAKMEASGKEIWPNVDFFSGTLYTLMGIEPIDYTPIFALSRVSGWTAHILELWNDNRLYRPKAHYVGEKDLEYTPINNR